MGDSDKTLKLLIDIGVIGKEDAQAVSDLLTEAGAKAKGTADEMGVLSVSQEEVEKATNAVSEATGKGSEKWGENRREIREVGNEFGRALGVMGGGALALGGVAAAGFAAGKAIEFFKDTLKDVMAAIQGPIVVNIPENYSAKVSAAATAWQEYAAARQKAIDAENTPETAASEQEKKLANELKLIKEVLAAQKEKALADLELQKGNMSPEDYNAARENINNIFGEAEQGAEKKNRRELIANKAREADNLEIDAQTKTQQALAIKVTPEDEREKTQKVLDDNAAAGEKAMEETKKKLALLDRLSHPDRAEYEGAGGKVQQQEDYWEFYKSYGYSGTIAEARALEETHKAQAQAQIDAADSYRKREADNAKKQKDLMDQAGTESAKAAGLRKEVGTDSEFEKQQNAVDSYVGKLHDSSADKVAASSVQTAQAVGRFTAVTVGGFQDVHAILQAHEQHLQQLTSQIRNTRQIYGGG